MSRFTSVVKDGWHPKGKDGGKESWRGDFKGIDQVAGWMGKGRTSGGGSGGSAGSEYVSRPLATLKDPALFGPPPKNVNFHGGAALLNEITPDRRGLGVPLDTSQLEVADHERHALSSQEEEDTKPPGPPVPYRADRTGLSTDHLPPPPTHHVISEPTSAQRSGISHATPKPKPSLPPRLPPRRESSNSTLSVAPPTYDAAVHESSSTNGGLNQGAMDRLSNAGVSVPTLGIDESNPWKSEKSASERGPSSNGPQLGDLQSRFSRMNSGSPRTAPGSSEGTTVAQKKAALNTAQSFHKDPSSVTFADAKTAASTANNFRERHQEQISAGAQKANAKANAWNKKYNLTGRMNSFLEQHTSPTSDQPPALQSPSSAASDSTGFTTRKPPPPPPPQKPRSLHGQHASGHVPPPVPLGTKPSVG